MSPPFFPSDSPADHSQKLNGHSTNFGNYSPLSRSGEGRGEGGLPISGGEGYPGTPSPAEAGEGSLSANYAEMPAISGADLLAWPSGSSSRVRSTDSSNTERVSSRQDWSWPAQMNQGSR